MLHMDLKMDSKNKLEMIDHLDLIEMRILEYSVVDRIIIILIHNQMKLLGSKKIHHRY
jgi:hypothetical protein